MGTIVVYLILTGIIAFAVYGTIKRIRYGSSCCGTHEPAPKKVKVADKNKDHYPYRYLLHIDGMYCSNCARRIENAFNTQNGMWATADVGRKSVELRCISETDEAALRSLVSEAGYTLLSIEQLSN